MAAKRYKGSTSYFVDKSTPFVARFGDNITEQNQKCMELGSTISTDKGKLEDWFQSINSLASLLAGWWDLEFFKEVDEIFKLPSKSIRDRVEAGHRLLSALMRLEKRSGFQGTTTSTGYISPFFRQRDVIEKELKQIHDQTAE